MNERQHRGLPVQMKRPTRGLQVAVDSSVEGRIADDGCGAREEGAQGADHHGDHQGLPEIEDPLELIRTLEASPRFRRDSPLGGLFHRGKISFREVCEKESLHVLIVGNKVSAHVDTISPLRCAPDGSARYSWARVLVHNACVLADDLGRRVRGHHGRQRCNLDCEVVWVDDDEVDVDGEAHSHESLHGEVRRTL